MIFQCHLKLIICLLFQGQEKDQMVAELTIVSIYKLLFVRKKKNKKQRCIKNSLLHKLLAKFFPILIFEHFRFSKAFKSNFPVLYQKKKSFLSFKMR